MRSLAAMVAVLVAAAGCTSTASDGPSTPTTPTAPTALGSPASASASGGPATSAAGPAPRLRVRLTRWHTPTPLSRPVVAVAADGALLVVGGLTGGTSTDRVLRLDPATGRVSTLAPLAVATHDAAVLTLHGRTFVLGGGTSATTDLVQELGSAGHSPRAVGHLPRPRSDAVGVQAGGTGYVVGGYDGSTGSRAVLATRDGRTFGTVARLRVAVRYPAVAVSGGDVWVFGGVAVGGARAGQPLDVIQRVDPRRHRVSVVGHLPTPLQGAVAVTLGSTVYVAGGRSSPSSSAPASRTVYALDGTRDAVRRVGRLPLAASNAGVAAAGGRAWIIGGESSGHTLSSVQTLIQRAASTS